MSSPQNSVPRNRGHQSNAQQREDSPRDVEELRAELGDTVEELVHRVDVPARLREKRAETSERVQLQVNRAREVVAERAPAVQSTLRERPAVVGAVVAALLYLLLRRKRRRSHRTEDIRGTG